MNNCDYCDKPIKDIYDQWTIGGQEDYESYYHNNCLLVRILRPLTAKPSKQATQREKNIYRSANALLSALDEPDLPRHKENCSYFENSNRCNCGLK